MELRQIWISKETDEQAMIRQMVRDFAEECSSAPTAALRDKEQRPPLDEWESFCQLGLQSMSIPEKWGAILSMISLRR